MAAPLIAAALLTACAAPQVREQRVEDIPLAVTYERAPAASAESAEFPGLGAAAEGPWSERFGDERLDRLIDAVLKTNTDLASAGLRLQQAHLQAGLAFDALLPHADASVSASDSKLLKTGTGWVRGYGATVSASYEVDLWGRLRAQRTIATWEVQATEEDLQSTRLALIGETCNLYWNLAFLNQRVASGDASLARLERTLRLVQTQFKAGDVSRLELREAEQALEAQRAVQSQMIQARVEARNALTLILDGRAWAQGDEPQDLSGARSPGIQAGIPAELLHRRPDLRASELRLRESLRQIHVVSASYYPAINLTGSAGGSSASLGTLLANPVATLGAGLTLPFLRWNERNLNVALAGRDYEIAANDFRAKLYTAFSEVDNALSAKAELATQLALTQKSYQAAIEVERLYEVRYRSGATPLQTWLDAQETRRAAELALAQARLTQLQNDAALFQALGGD